MEFALYSKQCIPLRTHTLWCCTEKNTCGI